MSNFDERDTDTEDFDEGGEDYITLTDEEGNEVSFEIIDTVQLYDRVFSVLLPFDEEDDGVVILEVLPADDPEYDDFVSIEDENLLNEVYEEFKKNYTGVYRFE